MNRFLIIDGNAMVHRAYHALPPLTSPTGAPVHAVYGFFSMLGKAIEYVKPEYLAVCFDRPTPTFRKKLYDKYQANRPEMPEDLSSQFSLLNHTLEEIGVAIYEKDGYEADDVIGTITAHLEDSRMTHATIVTGDRDLLQLVTSSTHVLLPLVGMSKMVVYDEEKVKEKFGITAQQIIDYKALIGDASDGYPGVGGIGPKTAVHLLTTYHTFEGIYQYIAAISPSIGKKLQLDKEQAVLAKKLATIVRTVPFAFDPHSCSLKNIPFVRMYDALTNLGFKSLPERLSSIAPFLGGKEREKKDQLALEL